MTRGPTASRAHRISTSTNSDLTTFVTKVLPLTGDASDRRYFRVLLREGESIVLALHAGAIDFETLPFVAWRA